MNLLQEFVHFLLNQKNKPSSLTVKNYKADIRQFIGWFEKEFNSSFDPSKITLQILEQYKKARNLSPSSIERHFSSLRKFFSFLKAKRIIFQHPLENKTASSGALPQEDPWMLRNFKSHLYDYRKSNLTIKNYINDIKSFFTWLSEVSLTKYAWNVADKNLLNKINLSAVEEYKQRLIASNFSPLTINRKLSSLRSYISWAKKAGFISENSEYSENQNVRPSDNQTARLSESPSLPSVPNYSSFPPLRLAQKSVHGANLLFDNLLIEPLAEIIEDTQYLFWKITGKKVFRKNVVLNPSTSLRVKDPIHDITNIKKEFYAPLDISTHYLPRHKRVWHYIRHVRPKWYKTYHSYSFTRYLHFGLLIILASAVGFGIYNSLFLDAQKQNAVLAETTNSPPRILSFKGRLTDPSDSAITATTDILFSIYSDENAPESTSLWQETNSVNPDANGSFSILLGKKNPIPEALFDPNSRPHLGIKVGDSPELRPRQQLATVPLATNAQTLQGLEPITNTNKTSNVVLTLDSAGNLSIAGSKAHTFQTIGGQFVLSGNILSLTTIPGSNGNVEIAPDGLGKIDLSKPIHNSSNNNNLSGAIGAVEFDDIVAILATSSAQSAFNINQTSSGPLISASTSGIAKFVVENDGTGTFGGSLGVNGTSLTSTAATFNLLNSSVTTLNFAGDATNIIIGTSSGTLTLKNANTTMQGNVTLGDATTDTLNFVGRVAQDSDLNPITTSGTNDLGSSSLQWDNAYINNIYTLKLDVQDSQEATATAQIFNTNTGTDADGLVIKLGNTSTTAVNASNHFVSFETAGIGIVGSIQGNGGKGITYATSGVADFAEYFKKDKNSIIEFGSVVCLNNGLVVKCDGNNGKILGIASERPAFLGGENLGDGSITVGLIGQVDTLVSLSNGSIKAGDPLSASDIPGVAVKATKAGQIVGKSLENLDNIDESKVVGYYDPDNKEYRSKSSFPDIPLKSNIIKVVKINTFANISWFDPGAYLANNGDLVIHKTGSNGYSISNSKNETLTSTGGFLEVIAANIKAGLINTSEVITSSLIVTTDSIIINGQNLKEYIVSVANEFPLRQDFGGQAGIISPVLKTKNLATDVISPLSHDSNISISLHDSQFIIHDSPNASGSAIVTINSSGDASFSGTLASKNLEINNDASVSGTLRARSIIAESIEGFIDIASFSANLAYVPNLQAEQGLFNQGLMVFGSTSLSDLSIADQLSINGTMFLGDNSLNTLGSDLYIQNLRQGGISIMAGLITIDTDGNLKVSGDVSISGKLAVNVISPLPTSDLVVNNASGSGVLSINQTGDLIASGSGTFSKLNLSLVQPVLAVSSTEVIASSSAGVANINSYQNELTIKNALVTDKSVIYITPVGTPSAQAPFLMRQVPDESFTVGVESPNKNPIPFNWLIVN